MKEKDIKASQKILALKMSEVRSYFDRVAKISTEKIQAFHDSIAGNKTKYRVDNGVAIIPITSFISQYYDFYCWLFDGIAVENIEAQFDDAIADPKIRGIILDINSPGGEIGGVNDLSNKIFESRNKKPIIAYVSDEAASAGYWIAAAASKIVTGQTALVGSIGVYASFETDDDDKNVKFVSSISPNKVPDLNEPEGKAQIQAWVNELGSIFVKQVALFRGVPETTVLSDFGKGDISIASKALDSKMIDVVGNFKTALSLAAGKNNNSGNISEKNKIRGNKSVSKIFAKIKKGLRAELVIVDDEAQDAVIPADSMPVSEIDIPWLEQNLPELVEELRQQGRDEEAGRQGELDEMEPVEASEETAALMKSIRRDTSISKSNAALKLIKSFKENPPKTDSGTGNNGPGHVSSNAGAGGNTVADELKEFKAGAQRARDNRKRARGN